MTVKELKAHLDKIPLACVDYEVSVSFDSGFASTGIEEIFVLWEREEVHFNRERDVAYDLEIVA